MVWMGFRNLYFWKRPHFIPGCGVRADDWWCYCFYFSHCELLPVVVSLYCVLNGQMYIEICLWVDDGTIKILRYNFYPIGQERICI